MKKIIRFFGMAALGILLGNFNGHGAMVSGMGLTSSLLSGANLASLIGRTVVQQSIILQSSKLSDTESEAIFKQSHELGLKFNAIGEMSFLEEALQQKFQRVIVRPPFFVDFPKRIKLGENVFINNNFAALSREGIEIGDSTWVAPNVQFYTEIPETLKSLMEFKAGSITVGKNSWIGGGVKIFPGVTIGDETVIGSGSIVTENIPSRVIAVGNPCRIYMSIDEYARRPALDVTSAIHTSVEGLTEMEKMLRGMPAKVHDPELVEMRGKVQEISLRFNNTNDPRLLEELFEQRLEGVKVEAPIHLDYGRFIRFGKNVAIGMDCAFISSASIELGDNVVLEPYVQIYSGGHPIDPIERLSGIGVGRKIKIGANSHVGMGAIILQGVELGDRVTVLPGSVVTKSFSSGVTVGGNPARVIEIPTE